MMDSGNRPSPADWEHFEARLLEGVSAYDAARERGLTSSFYRRSDPVRHSAALAEMRDANHAKANQLGEEWATRPDADPRLQIAYLKAHSPDYRQGDQLTIEHGGNVGVQVDLDVGSILDKLVARGVVAGGDQNAVDAAPVELLPARADGAADVGSDRAQVPAEGRT